MVAIDQFAGRLRSEWLPNYCVARDYAVEGFKGASLRVEPADARDCMAAIEQGVVVDCGGGRYRAARSAADEVLFWEGRRDVAPRPISLWLEPVITFAALARLHLAFGWPKERLASQPAGWAFDVAAYAADDTPTLLGEVKKSLTELDRLRADLERLEAGAEPSSVPPNSRKKWNAMLAFRPRVVGLLGPGQKEHVYVPIYTGRGAALQKATSAALQYSVA